MFVATNKGGFVLSAIKKGTKLTDNPKNYMLRVRMDDSTVNKLDLICEKHNISRSEAVRKGLDELYQKLK